MEYLDTIMNLIFGGVGVGGLITALYYRKANKAIKEEAKKVAVEIADINDFWNGELEKQYADL